MPGFTRRETLAASLGALIGEPWRSRAMAATRSGGVVRHRNERRYTVTHSAVVENGDAALKSLEIWVPIPTDQPEQQIRSLKIEPQVPILRDTGGQAAVARLYLAGELVPGTGESRRLQVSYQVACRETVLDSEAVQKYRFQPYRDDRTYRHFTRPEEKIETTLPEIVAAAEKLRGRRRTPLDVARAAYDWVLQRTEYKLIDGLGGAAYCLRRGHGECGDYSALFVALCRAAGIPARPVAGFWADRTDGWHCWAEFMLPTGEWIPVDPSVGDQNDRNRRRYFGGLDNRRVALCKTYDVTLAGTPVGRRSLDFLQVGAWWWTVSKPLEGKRRPKAKFSVTGKPSKV